MSRRSRWPSLFALPLALWSTIPGVEWCRVGWADVRLECLASCSIERSGCRPDTGERATSCQATCPLEAAGCPAAVESDAGQFPGGRAYCLGGPSGGNGVPASPPPAADPAPMAAVVPEAPQPEPARSHADRTSVPSRAPPAVSATWAPTRSRAPPMDPTT